MKKITHDKNVLAIIIESTYDKDGVEFFTPPDFSQQLAYMAHKKGKRIDAHVHNVVKREVHYTKEVLIIRKGKLRVDFYSDEQKYIKSAVLEAGDIILLQDGGHGFECLEDVKMIEIKQGPYLGEQDKTRFQNIDASEVKLV